MNKRSVLTILWSVCMIFTAMPLSAQVTTESFAGDVDTTAVASDDTPIDEITVVGQKTLGQLKRVMVAARLDFWDEYNQLNDVPEYRMICREEDRLGTRFKRVKCAPAYFREKMSEVSRQAIRRTADDSIQLRSITPQDRDIAALTREQKKAADAHVISLIESNPTLRDRYEELLKASARYEAASQRSSR